MPDSTVTPLTEVSAEQIARSRSDNHWIDSDWVVTTIGELRRGVQLAIDKFDFEESSDTSDTYDEGYDDGLEEGITIGYNKAIREQREKEGKTDD